MDKAEHGLRLKAAMSAKGHRRSVVADATGVQGRTVTNWTTGQTMPEDAEREALRNLYPGYDTPGDPVETSIRHSELDEWRQDTVIGFYKMHLSQQQGQEQHRA